MSATDVFSTPCWNFIGGDRAIEGILRRLKPGSRLVVRNRMANVLPTVAGIADLGAVGHDMPPITVRVPENALFEPALGLDDVYPPEVFFAVLLDRLYGVSELASGEAPTPGAVLVASGFTEAQEAAANKLAAWLRVNPDLQTVFVCPRGASLAACLRPFAATAWSCQHGGSLNAFALPTIEEAVWELEPTQILVAAPHSATRAHTAIGAIDGFVRAEAVLQGAKQVRPELLGGRVRVLDFATTSDLGGLTGPPATLRALLCRHLTADLGVSSTAADARITPTREAIAIDLI